jgi:hypothetical protein
LPGIGCKFRRIKIVGKWSLMSGITFSWSFNHTVKIQSFFDVLSSYPLVIFCPIEC